MLLDLTDTIECHYSTDHGAVDGDSTIVMLTWLEPLSSHRLFLGLPSYFNDQQVVAISLVKILACQKKSGFETP